MVPLSIDFYKLKDEIRREILNRIEKMSVYDHPVDICWLAYALAMERDDIIVQRIMRELENWALSEDAGKKNRDLGALSLYAYLKGESNVESTVIEKIKLLLGKNISRPIIQKFNILNDPGQVFCVSLVNYLLEPSIKDKLVDIIKRNINGGLTRKILFVAALIELGVDPEEFKRVLVVEGEERFEDILTYLWLIERYRDVFSEDTLKYWMMFEKIYPYLEIEEEGEDRFNISNRDLAFLYEAILREIKEPDPNMLFDLYPIHPEIKKVSAEHFKNKKYSSAVFQAVQKLKELIENLTGIKNKMEVDLVRETMNPRKLVKGGNFQWKTPDELIIHFNEFLDELHGRNEQEGLALIAEGIFKAFRHPRGHKPEGHPLLEIGPYGALDQLIIIDYIWRRVESAKINKK